MRVAELERGNKNKINESVKSSSMTRGRSIFSIIRPSLLFFSIRLVFFPNWLYIALAGAVSSIFWIMFSVFDQLLFFSPIFVFYLSDDAVIGFILSTITEILMGIVVSMNVYIMKHSGNLKVTIGSLFSGSTM